MTNTHPFIIETQLRLIRAFQRGYIEALEAGDWQAADYRCAHLHKLCEGLYYLSQSLVRESSSPIAGIQRSANSWVSSIRSLNSSHSQNNSSYDNSSYDSDKPMVSPPPPPDLSRYMQDVQDNNLQIKPPPIDEVWE